MLKNTRMDNSKKNQKIPLKDYSIPEKTGSYDTIKHGGSVKNEVLQRPQKSIRVGSAVLITEGDKILLGRRNKEPNFGKWVLPGGKIEFGETHVQAAYREAKEELGLEIEVIRLAGDRIYYIIEPDEHRIIVYSIARVVRGDVSPSSDISEARFFTRNEIKDIEITPVVSQVLKDEGWL